MERLLFGPEPILWFQQALGPGWQWLASLVSVLGGAWGIALAVGLALACWGRREAYTLAGAVAVASGLNLLLNTLVGLPRPDAQGVVKYEHVAIASFPSGHVLTATVLWGLLAARRRVPGALAVLLVLAVAASRFYLGVHYLGDLLGGALLGVGFLWASARLLPGAARWLEARSRRFYRVLAGLGLVACAVGAWALARGDDPFAWRAAGLVLGAALGLPLEYRFVRYRPTPAVAGRRARRWARAGLGPVGLVPLLLVEQLVVSDSLPLRGALVAAATLWGVLLTPALLARGGLGERASGP